MLKRLALLTIGLYQRYLSPRKGYPCAYRVRAGGMGCSGFGKHAIRKHGLFLGLVLLRRRTAKCAWQAQQHTSRQNQATNNHRFKLQNYGRFSNQAGSVDCDCNGCDTPDCDFPDLGCGNSRSSSTKAASTCGFISDCGTGCNSCGDSSRSGAKREEKRLSRVRQRQDKSRSRKKSADGGDFDFDGGGDGD